ncbi:MAG: chaperone modulator CbpM [Oleiphilaceae bacterium]|nr:chaperone modulator CbpM [Oleiphilaceae bacterium]
MTQSSSKQRVIRVRQVDMIEEGVHFSLREICEREKVTADRILELIAHGIAEPSVSELPPSQWEFEADAFFRISRALRLQRDLQVNTAGAAITLELLDELNELRTEVRRLRARVGK